MPGFDDIPALFDAIVKSGVYDPTTILTCMGVGDVAKTPTGLSGDAVQLSLTDGIDVLSGAKTSIPAVNDLTNLNPYIETTEGPKGGISWRILDSAKTTRDEIESMSRVLMNVGINRRCIPSHVYDLTMQTNVITVVMQWTGDAKRHALADDNGTGYIVQPTSGLQQKFPEKCNNLREALKGFDNVGFMKDDQISKEWQDAAGRVAQGLNDLVAETNDKTLDPKDPLRLWLAPQSGLWPAASQDLQTVASDPEFLKRTPYDKRMIPAEAINMMRNSICRIIGDSGTSGDKTFALWAFDGNSQTVLNQPDAAAAAVKFVAEFGHYLIDSYTEAGTLSAVWTIKLNEGLSIENLLLRRVAVERYFATARTVEEACEYFAHGIWDAFQADIRSVKTTIYGFRKPGATEPKALSDIEPAQAKYYLTPEALHRNVIRSDYGMRAYKDLRFDYGNSEQIQKSFEQVKTLPIPQISPVYILGLQKIMSYLFTLSAYAKEPRSGIADPDLDKAWSTFGVLQERKTLNGDGSISPATETQINQLREDLETRLLSAEEKMYSQPRARHNLADLSLPTL